MFTNRTKTENKLLSLNLVSWANNCVRKLYLLPILVTLVFLLNAGCFQHTPLRNRNEVGLLRIEELAIRPIDLPHNSNPAFSYWVRNGDFVSIEWKSFTVVNREEGSQAFCTFENSSEDGCIRENLCVEGSGEAVEDFDVALTVDTDFLRIGDGDFVIDLTDAVRERKACKSVNNVRPKFSAKKSGLYRLSIIPSFFTQYPDETMGEIELHVVGSSQIPQQTVTYNLKKERIDSTDFWRWEIPARVVWSDNFTKNVRVKEVRILNNESEVKPSRIILLSGYNGTVLNHPQYQQSSCFNNPNTSQDKNIDLTKCRKQYSSNSQTENKKVTPTYIHGQASNKLYWFAEFDTSQGGDDVSNNNELKIEFTLEAVN